jgi:hypothetical protein
VWIIIAWQRISPEMTVKGFKKCCVSNTVNGTDGVMLWNGTAENGDVRSEGEEEEGTDFDGGDGVTD